MCGRVHQCCANVGWMNDASSRREQRFFLHGMEWLLERMCSLCTTKQRATYAPPSNTTHLDTHTLLPTSRRPKGLHFRLPHGEQAAVPHATPRSLCLLRVPPSWGRPPSPPLAELEHLPSSICLCLALLRAHQRTLAHAHPPTRPPACPPARASPPLPCPPQEIIAFSDRAKEFEALGAQVRALCVAFWGGFFVSFYLQG